MLLRDGQSPRSSHLMRTVSLTQDELFADDADATAAGDLGAVGAEEKKGDEEKKVDEEDTRPRLGAADADTLRVARVMSANVVQALHVARMRAREAALREEAPNATQVRCALSRRLGLYEAAGSRAAPNTAAAADAEADSGAADDSPQGDEDELSAEEAKVLHEALKDADDKVPEWAAWLLRWPLLLKHNDVFDESERLASLTAESLEAALRVAAHAYECVVYLGRTVRRHFRGLDTAAVQDGTCACDWENGSATVVDPPPRTPPRARAGSPLLSPSVIRRHDSGSTVSEIPQTPDDGALRVFIVPHAAPSPQAAAAAVTVTKSKSSGALSPRADRQPPRFKGGTAARPDSAAAVPSARAQPPRPESSSPRGAGAVRSSGSVVARRKARSRGGGAGGGAAAGGNGKRRGHPTA